MNLIICKHCNQLFEATHHSQKYCSSECRIIFWNKERKRLHWRPKFAIPKKCKLCGKLFKPIRKSQIYCSVQCATKCHPPPQNQERFIKYHFWTNKEWIEENYIKKKVSYAQVCREYRINRHMFYRWLKRLGIKSLPKSIVQKGKKNPFYGKKHTKETKEKLRGPRPHTAGEHNHEWRGGHPPYYGPNWHQQRRKARKRDNYTCQDCGKYQTKPALPVHHIIPFRIFGLKNYRQANSLKNLMTICIPCHKYREKLTDELLYCFFKFSAPLLKGFL